MIPLIHLYLFNKHAKYNHELSFMDYFRGILWLWNPRPGISIIEKSPDYAKARVCLGSPYLAAGLFGLFSFDYKARGYLLG